jgi:hypothetical protein
MGTLKLYMIFCVLCDVHYWHALHPLGKSVDSDE